MIVGIPLLPSNKCAEPSPFEASAFGWYLFHKIIGIEPGLSVWSSVFVFEHGVRVDALCDFKTAVAEWDRMLHDRWTGPRVFTKAGDAGKK